MSEIDDDDEETEDQKPQGAPAGDRRVDIISETAEVSAEKAADVDPISGPQPDEQHDRAAMAVDAEEAPRLAFPVVGIGASAGGLESVSLFIEAMRPDSGMAFVFIQHLPPEHETKLAEILQKKTRMTVFLIEDGMEVKPDHFYVIRPGHVVRIHDGRFTLGLQLGRGAANRPVDDFLKSLAEEQRERGIGILMSGMGSNGSAGAQALKAVGGLVIAQDPDTALYPSMPRHLIDQGYADYILAPSDMPEILLQYAGHPYARQSQRNVTDQVRRHSNQLREILAILRTRTRQDFNGYKKPTILRRIQRRMGLTRMTDMGEYARLLRQSPTEVSALADDLLIHVTGFFRDREAWEALHKRVITPLIARRESETEIRAWVTACSSGEEAYTMAMLLVEESERANKVFDIKVFATDMAERPLAHARAGIYPGGIESEIDAERLERFFDKEDGIYRIKSYLRECVVFAPQNVLQDPPFSRIDIISCRNLLIYLEQDVQHRVLSLLHFGLREGGTLFLGNSETVSGADDMYELVDKRARIYRRVGPTRHGMFDFPLPHSVRMTHTGDAAMTIAANSPTIAETARSLDRPLVGRPSLASLTARALLEHHTPAAITVDRDYRALYFHGNTRPFIEQPAGEPTRDLMMLTREGLRGPLRVALHRCAAERRAVTVTDGWLTIDDGRKVRVAVTASPLAADTVEALDHYVVSFEQRDEMRPEVDPTVGIDHPSSGVELRRVRDELQKTIEELQTSNEELKASHEEVTSINEELQSSNEELETSKEEMQSLNEELTTVNAQLQVKIEEHQSASNDLTALLASTSIAVLFLDPTLRIRRFTPPARELIELISSDIGRPLKDMHRKFDDQDLERDIRKVLEDLAPVEAEVTAANGKVFQRKVLPYRTVDHRIDGVVITFVDVTDRERFEREAAQAKEYAEKIVETLHEPILVLHPDLTVRSANSAFYEHFKVNESQTIGRMIYDLGNGQWNIPALRTLLEDVLPTNKVFNDYEVKHHFEDIGERIMLVNARRLDHVQFILLGIRDVTAEKRESERVVRASENRLKQMMNIEGVAILNFDESTGVVISANDAFQQMCGYTSEDVRGRRLTWRNLTAPEYIDESERQMLRLRQTGRIGPYEKEYLRKDGGRLWMMFAGARLGDGTVIEYCIDIGERKRAELAVRERESRLAAIFAHAAVGLSEVSPDGRMLLVNDTMCAMLGRSREELLSLSVFDVTHPEDREPSAAALKRVLAGSEVESIEKRYVRADGGLVDASSSLTILKHPEGGMATILAVTVEITGRRRAERAVAESEERFRLLVEGARDFAMIMQDPQGIITAWNTGAERLLGYSEREAVGQFSGIIFTEEDRVARAAERELEAAAAKGHAEDERWHVRKNGTRFWGSGVQTALRNPDGSIRGFVKIMRDQTERKRAEEALKQAKEAAEISNRMKDDFLATLSHELRTPLSAITIWTRLLRDRSLSEAQRNEGMDAIEHSAQSQKQLIDDLLDSSRITSGKLRLEMTSVPLAELVRSTVDAIGPTAEVKGVTVTRDLSGECGTVRADPERLRQIVWNLLTNAVKFTPAGGRIDVGLWRRKDNVELRISDTGRGIEPAFLPRVFERFSQSGSSKTRTGGGLGLGLAITKQLVELHGGTISAESAGLDAGATFRVLLPLRPVRTPKFSDARARPSAPAAINAVTRTEDSALGGLRILLVEDELMTRTATRALLTAAGAKVFDVATAREALQLLQEEPPDLLLSDIGLPEMDGHAMMRRIRADEAAGDEPPLRAIALTAFAGEDDERVALEAGYNRYISKPFKSEVLVETIRSLMDVR